MYEKSTSCQNIETVSAQWRFLQKRQSRDRQWPPGSVQSPRDNQAALVPKNQCRRERPTDGRDATRFQ